MWESTRETDLKAAVTVRNRILEAARGAALQDRLGEFALRGRYRAAAHWPLMQEVINRFEKHGQERRIGQRTMVGYVSSLRTVLKGAGHDLTTARTNVLTEKTVEDYVSAALAEKDSDSSRRTIASTLTQAKAIFGARAMKAYRDIRLPDMAPFRAAGRFSAPVATFRFPNPAIGLTEELVAKTKEEARKLKGPKRVTWLLCYELGLRAAEVAFCRWNWFTMDPAGGIRLNILNRPEEGFHPKHHRERVLPVHPDLWKTLLELKGQGEFLIDLPNQTARENLIARDFATWMTNLGWKTEKKAHELRRLRGSEWYSRMGAEVAQTWLGHKDISMTCRVYATLTRQPAPLAPEL
jgi:integrase